MLWNELDFEVQRTVLSKVINLLDDEPDKEMQEALQAAFLELRMWSNFPCSVIDEETPEDKIQAKEPY